MEIKPPWETTKLNVNRTPREITILKGMYVPCSRFGQTIHTHFLNKCIAQGACGRWCKPLYVQFPKSSKLKQRRRDLVWVQLLLGVDVFLLDKIFCYFTPKKWDFFLYNIFNKTRAHFIMLIYFVKFCQVVLYVLWKANFLL